MSNLTDANGWADLHSPVVKEANTRAAAPLFSFLCRTYFDGAAPLHVALRECAVSLSGIYACLYGSPMIMTAEQKGTLRVHCLQFGTHMLVLREWGRNQQRLLFNVTPKVHKMQHLPFYADALNPRYVQCYGEESLIGTTAKVWKSSMSGRYQKRVQETVLLKRTLGLLLRFEV